MRWTVVVTTMLALAAPQASAELVFKRKPKNFKHVDSPVRETLKSRWRTQANRTKYRYVPSMARLAGRVRRSMGRYLWHMRKPGKSRRTQGFTRPKWNRPRPRPDRPHHHSYSYSHKPHTQLIHKVQAALWEYHSGQRPMDQRYVRLQQLMVKLKQREQRRQQQQLKEQQSQKKSFASRFRKLFAKVKGHRFAARDITRGSDAVGQGNRPRFRIFASSSSRSVSGNERGGLKRLWSMVARRTDAPAPMIRPTPARMAPSYQPNVVAPMMQP